MSRSAEQSIRDLAADLRRGLRGDVFDDPIRRALYATDGSMYEMMPLAVVVPRDLDDVRQTVSVAASRGVPVLPRGGGSSLAGQTVGHAVVIDFSRHIDKILDFDAKSREVVVEPGVVLDTLNAYLAPHNLMVGPDPASSNRATIGGMVANNATGTHSILYGNMIDHVCEAEAILSDGSSATFGEVGPEEWADRGSRSGLEGAIYRGLTEILSGGADIIERDTPRQWRRASGYRLERLLQKCRNVSSLLCGSEGTLGLLSKVTVSLVERPRHTGLAIAHFDTRHAALRSVTTILETGASAIELLDGSSVEQARRTPGFAPRLSFIEGDPGGVLIIEYRGESDAQVADGLARMKALESGAEGCYRILTLTGAAEVANVWGVRKDALGLIMGVRGDHKPVALIEDASVPVVRLAEYIGDLDRYLDQIGVRSVMYAHASAGCLHVRPFLNTKDLADVEKLRDIGMASMELVRNYGGSVSSEHGDGIARSWLNPSFLGDELYGLCKRTKDVFDPDGILNPGKVVDPLPVTENLRFGPHYETTTPPTEFDWSRDGNFAMSVELCNGIGVCRKLSGGTMCPSFMVTRDEIDSTRGRANALRAVLSGRVDPKMLTGKEMHAAMDLCVQCKACKTECPSSVDMARIKTEWLNFQHAAGKTTLRSKVFARLPVVAPRMSGRKAAVANRLMRSGVGRRILGSIGIDSRRTVPGFARERLSQWYARNTVKSDGPPVVLFADTFAEYQEPHIGIAAVSLLRGVGYDVSLVAGEGACCGRTFLSKGFIAEARRSLESLADRLEPYAREGVPIIGLEPSCILTLRDEMPDLLSDRLKSEKVSGATATLAEFVAADPDGLFARAKWTDRKSEIIYHGHCHEKALVGTAAAASAMSLPEGYRTTVLDSGCCGMAGSFGYEKEHWDVSVAMAERVLLPAIRSAADGAIVSATGTSCRAQIRDLANIEAKHPAEVLWEALRPA